MSTFLKMRMLFLFIACLPFSVVAEPAQTPEELKNLPGMGPGTFSVSPPGFGHQPPMTPSIDSISTVNRPVKSIAAMLMDLKQGLGVDIAVDEVGERIIIRGNPEHVQEIKKLVQMLDKPLPQAVNKQVQIKTYFIRCDTRQIPSENKPEVPEAILPVVKTLAYNGYYNPQLIAQFIVQAQQHQTFRVGGSLFGKSKLQAIANVEGTVGSQPEPGKYMLTISGALKLEDQSAKTTADVFSVKTSLHIVPGELVVLSTAPTDPNFGPIIALAIQIEVLKSDGVDKK